MSTLLRIDTSARHEGSHSRKLADLLQHQWQSNHPEGQVVQRDLNQPRIPHIEQKTIEAYYTPAEQKTPAHFKATALSDQLIAEVQAADTLLISTPMYNFSVPSALKAWIDQVVRIGVTFGYDAETGPYGLLQNKTAYIVTASGAPFAGTELASMDHLAPYLKTVLGFIGFNPVEVISFEGTTMDETVFNAAEQQAQQTILQLFGHRLEQSA